MRNYALIVTCEHATAHVPRAWSHLFASAGAQAALRSHRGWDAGALELARQLARTNKAPLIAARTSRLLIDTNRSLHHARVFSPFSRSLGAAARAEVRDAFYTPHRERVLAAVRARLAARRRVVHIAIHSFTPVLSGEPRRADIGWLYDPRRADERAFAGAWRAAVALQRPELHLRRNYPYQGRADGLTTAGRRLWSDARYIGIELEVNQLWPRRGGAAWRALRDCLVRALPTTWPTA